MATENKLEQLLKQRGQTEYSQPSMPTKKPDENKPTILIVDDESSMLQALNVVFSSSYNVVTAIDGKQAIDLFKQNKNVSCVVTDALMPNLDGFQTANCLHQINQDIPIIMLTAHQSMHEPSKVVDFNFKGYVTKGNITIDADGRMLLPSIDDLESRVKSACEEYSILLRKKAFFDSLKEERDWLDEKIKERTEELKVAKEMVDAANRDLEKKIEERTRELRKANDLLRENEIQIKKSKEELEEKNRTLEETNTALNVIIRKREEDQRDLEEKILVNIKQLMMPLIYKLKTSISLNEQKTYLDLLENTIQNEIISPFLHNLSSKSLNLTPQELRIASFIREGKTSKEIADILNLAQRTVDFHRQNLRTKLNLDEEKGNLRSYLMRFDK